MDLSHQLAVGKVPGVHDAGQSVAKDVRVVSIVEPPLQLFEVAVY